MLAIMTHSQASFEDLIRKCTCCVLCKLYTSEGYPGLPAKPDPPVSEGCDKDACGPGNKK